MGKASKCSDLNLNDSGSLFFWALIILLFVLVVGNFILTLTIISFFKIGMGMESIKLIPELKAIKFYGSADFNRIYKKDGLIESFRESPAVIEADDNFIKFDLVDRKGQVHNRFMMGQNGTEVKGMNLMMIKEPNTNLPIYASSKLKYNIEKPTRSLESNIVHAPEVVSAVDKKLEVQAINLFMRGIEGTKINAKEILATAEQHIVLRSNGSIVIDSKDGIFIDRITRLEDTESNSNWQYKLCLCYPRMSLYRVPSTKMPGMDDPCRHYGRRLSSCV